VLYMWLLEQQSQQTFSKRYVDMERTMLRTLQAVGFMDGTTITQIGQFYR